MPIRYDGQHLVLEGDCDIRDTEELVALLEQHPGEALALADCRRIHTALFQLLWRRRVPVAIPPRDPFIARWLLPWLVSSQAEFAGAASTRLGAQSVEDSRLPAQGAEETRLAEHSTEGGYGA